jgi:Rps23 Pro-64 3,4-dihydroxylase Tpa1-like proline 4-hydroxylase
MREAISTTIYNSVEQLSAQFQMAVPFPHVVIDNFLNSPIADSLYQNFPEISVMHRSHHYLFANKYELSFWGRISDSFELLRQEVSSTLFQKFIHQISDADVFMDTEIYGDVHQGVNGSFLDMHVDFNLHPKRETWVHWLNMIIYLNPDWQEEYGGALQFKHGLEGNIHEIAPLFNRCVIMRSNDLTYHGYSQLKLPPGVTRKSIIAHFYKEEPANRLPANHPTVFVPSQSGMFKSNLAKLYNPLSMLKRRLFGSSSAW